VTGTENDEDNQFWIKRSGGMLRTVGGVRESGTVTTLPTYLADYSLQSGDGDKRCVTTQ
jgi:hypothetical protein